MDYSSRHSHLSPSHLVADPIMSGSGHNTTNPSATSTGSTNSQPPPLAPAGNPMAAGHLSRPMSKGPGGANDDYTSATASQADAKPSTKLVFTKKAIRNTSLRRQSSNQLSALVASSASLTGACPLHGRRASTNSRTLPSESTLLTRSAPKEAHEKHQQRPPSSLSPSHCELCPPNSTFNKSSPQHEHVATNRRLSTTTNSSIDLQHSNKPSNSFTTPSPSQQQQQTNLSLFSSKTPVLSVEIGTQFSFKSTNRISRNPSPETEAGLDQATLSDTVPGPLRNTAAIEGTSTTTTQEKAPIPPGSEPPAVALASPASLGSDLSQHSTSTSTTSPTSSSLKRTLSKQPSLGTKMDQQQQSAPTKTSPTKRMTSESVLPTLYVRQASAVKLLGLHRTTSSIDASTINKLYQNNIRGSINAAAEQHQSSTVSLPASPAKSSILASAPGQDKALARRNGSTSPLESTIAFAAPPPKQLHSMKTPLYVPSVLRRTATVDKLSSYTGSASLDEVQGLDMLSMPVGARMGTANVFGPPSTAHWKPDTARSSCRECSIPFSLFVRRHHCRRCGDLFCAKDSMYTIRLDQQCQFHLLGDKVRACSQCHDAYVEFWFNPDVGKSSLQAEQDEAGPEYNFGGSESSTTLSSDDSPSRLRTLSSETLKSNASSSGGSSNALLMLRNTSTLSQVMTADSGSAGGSGSTESSDSRATLTGFTAKRALQQQQPQHLHHQQQQNRQQLEQDKTDNMALDAYASSSVVGSIPANWSWSTF